MGPCAGGAVYSPALTDFIFMVNDTSYMFVTGPEVVKTVTYEDITKDELGGSDVHSQKTGVADMQCENDIDALMRVRELLTFLPSSNTDMNHQKYQKNKITFNKSLDTLIPDNPNISYNMKELIHKIVDNGIFFEIQEEYAKNIITCFSKINNITVGIVANQPTEMAGCIDISASRKGGRFVRFCDAFNIPIITFVDVPGFLPGKEQEHGGIIKHGAKLLYAYGEATVPKITVITRKAYGGAYIVMGSKHLSGDINLAWANAEIAVMGASGAAEILFRKNSKSEAEMQQKIQEYKDKFYNPLVAANRGFIDDIIKPHYTKHAISNALSMLSNKKISKPWKKHDNLPL
jgi:propionyl-CoA carboxylase beta chain